MNRNISFSKLSSLNIRILLFSAQISLPDNEHLLIRLNRTYLGYFYSQVTINIVHQDYFYNPHFFSSAQTGNIFWRDRTRWDSVKLSGQCVIIRVPQGLSLHDNFASFQTYKLENDTLSEAPRESRWHFYVSPSFFCYTHSIFFPELFCVLQRRVHLSKNYTFPVAGFFAQHYL